MFMRLFLDYLAAFETLIIKGNFKDCKAIIKARLAFRKWRHDFDKDRDVIQKSRVVKQIDGQSDFSILWQYYVLGRKKYSEIYKN